MKEEDYENQREAVDLSYQDRLDVCMGASGTPTYGAQGAILASYMQIFEPADTPSGEDRTSVDIVHDLEDITELSVPEVARVLYYLGFRLSPPAPPYGPAGLKWMMKKR